MRTEGQIADNGAKSRGPVTTIGRAISAQDSTTDETRGCCSTETDPSTRKSQAARNADSSHRTTSVSKQPRPDTSARTFASWTAMRPVCAAATSAPSKSVPARARRNLKFPNEPKDFVE